MSICFFPSFYSYYFADVAADLTHQQGNISYMSGGIGQDESDAMEAAQGVKPSSASASGSTPPWTLRT
ncbi:MAG: hypothetical protein FGM23_06640 [Alphaproteobacteria bacterium]|nr:hypothetical protein [Alphaproteobacteria bacterium]